MFETSNTLFIGIMIYCIIRAINNKAKKEEEQNKEIIENLKKLKENK